METVLLVLFFYGVFVVLFCIYWYYLTEYNKKADEQITQAIKEDEHDEH